MKVRRHQKRTAVRHSLSSGGSDDDDDEHTPQKQSCTVTPKRSSERIRSKSRRTFQMPTKKAVLDSIPSTPATPKSVEKLKPYRLVNDFTRVTHRYNCDPVTSDDSDFDDFIVDDDDGDDDDDDGSNSNEDNNNNEDGDDFADLEQKDTKMTEEDDSWKLKQRHHRSILESDSDSENDGSQRIKHNSVIESDSEDDSVDKQSKKTETICEQTDPGNNRIAKSNVNVLQNAEQSDKSESETSGTSDSEIITPRPQAKCIKKSKLKRHVLASDSESWSGSDKEEQSKRRAVLLQDSDSDSEASQRLYSSNEDDEKMPSERVQLMSERRETRRKLFEQLKAKKRK